MKRRHLLAGLGAGIAGTLTGARAATPAPPVNLAKLSSYVTNVGDLLGTDPVPVQTRAQVFLQRLPERGYDRSTVAVSTAEGRVIGYLPTNQARILAPLIDAGLRTSAVVSEVKNLPRPAVRIEIMVAAHKAA